MSAPWPLTADELAAVHCRFGVDAVAGQPDVSEFKRRARAQQAWWRAQNDLPRGEHQVKGAGVPNGSRVELAYAQATGCNFLSEPIRAAVHHRLDHPEPHQTLNTARLWADLLSSMPMCFNLFGETWADPARLAPAASALWPGHPGQAIGLRFEWSRGRRDPKYLNNRSAFDAALLFDVGADEGAVLGIETKYHEDIRRERPPDPVKRMPRYLEVTEASGVFAPGWEGALVGTDLQQLWLDHLLVLSMLQHPKSKWSAGRFLVVYPAANPSVARAVERYRAVLKDDATFGACTIEALLDTHTLHEPTTEATFRERYLWPT